MVLKHSVQISQFLHMYQYELGAHAIKHLIVHVFKWLYYYIWSGNQNDKTEYAKHVHRVKVAISIPFSD